jgi:hypothetical protein
MDGRLGGGSGFSWLRIGPVAGAENVVMNLQVLVPQSLLVNYGMKHKREKYRGC